MSRGVLIWSLVLASGCGDLSNEDLVFLWGMPRAEEVALGVAADEAVGNALTGGLGAEAEYYGRARDVARLFDGVVGGALELVDNLGWGHAPTRRSESARVWGPVRNVGGSGTTVRLEIRRDRMAGDGPVYSFCMHAGPDALFAGGSPSCETPAANGLRLLTWGWFAPRDSETEGRAGRGEVHVDFEAIHVLGTFDVGDARGLLNVGYDFDDGGAARALHIEWVRIISLTGMSTERLEYDFGATRSGEVDFSFVLEGDIYADAGVVGFSANETLVVRACWAEGGPGRASVTVSGGDLFWGESAGGSECWDSNHDRTYWRFDVAHPAYSEEEGDASACRPVCPE